MGYGTRKARRFEPGRFPSGEVAAGQMAQVEKAIRTGQPARFVDEQSGKYAMYYVLPVLDADRKTTQLAPFIRDITERKQAENEIASLARFPSENPNPVLRLNSSRQRALRQRGSTDEFRGVEVVGDGPIVLGVVWWQMQLRARQTRSLTSNMARSRVYSFSVTPIAEEGYVNLYGRDITKRRQVEQECATAGTDRAAAAAR